MSAKVWIVIGLVSASALAVGAVVVGSHMIRTGAPWARRTGQPIPVMTAPVERTDVKESIGATGSVVPADFVSLTARVATRVESVSVHLGDIVAVGSVLVRFETDTLVAAVESATAERERASGDASRAALQLARVKTVFDQGLLPVTDYEKAQATLDAMQAELAAANGRLVQSKLQLSYTTVAAPVVGVVTQRLVNPGETPNVNSPLLVLGRIDPVLVAALVSEEHLGALRLQEPATVTFNAFPNDEFKGEVVRLDPTANSDTRTFQAFVRLPNKDLRLKPGLTAFVRLERLHPASLSVPSIALMAPTGPQETTLFVVEGGHARLRKVKVGAVGDGRTAILDGLNDGDQVVTAGQLYLRDGDKVRLGDGDVALSQRAAAPGTAATGSSAR